MSCEQTAVTARAGALRMRGRMDPHWEGQKGLLSPHLTTAEKERTVMLIYWPLAVYHALFDALYSLSLFLSFFLEPPSVVMVQHRLTANSISPGLKQSWRIRPQLMTVSGWFSLLVSSSSAKLVHLTSVPHSRTSYSRNRSTGHKFTRQEINMRILIQSFYFSNMQYKNVHHKANLFFLDDKNG